MEIYFNLYIAHSPGSHLLGAVLPSARNTRRWVYFAKLKQGTIGDKNSLFPATGGLVDIIEVVG